MNQVQPKVFEFAKEIGVETLALMDKIREWKLPVRSHMATLDDEMQAEIRKRLEAANAAVAEEALKAKRKAVRSKKAAEAAAGTAAPAAEKEKKKGPAVKKTAVRKTAAPAPPVKPITKATVKRAAVVEAPVETETAPAVAPEVIADANSAARPVRSTVIRRKAGEAEAAAQAAAEAAQLAAAQAAAQAAEMATEAGADGGALDPLGNESALQNIPVTPEARTRRNIVGRMDLRRVASPNAGTQAGGPGQPRVSRTAPRNIRPGFYSQEATTQAPMPEVEDAFQKRERELREEKAKTSKRPGVAGSGREEVPQVFTATEFRKREVIFQPKKKKSMIGSSSKKTQLTTPAAHKRVVEVHGSMSLGNLAGAMGLKAPALMKKLMTSGVQASMNAELDFDTIALVVPEFGWEAVNTLKSESELVTATAFGDLDAERVVRPPVVTVMGHVDHGKTSLLDAIRKAKVAAGEAGGITQHIGAYNVTLDDGSKITFIDTPGHEAFTAMRARGANLTDIAIIVVAADDGMMPQTVEAVNHAKAAGVPIIVAINKMDKPAANPERIKQQLTELELVPEEWGGTTMYAPVSALKGDGIKELLERIALVAEVQELRANPKRSGTGLVIESRMEKGRGTVATVLVQDGTVTIGKMIVAGTVVGRVRSMTNDQGKTIKEAGPGEPIEILGLPEPPMAGDRFDIAKDEDSAREIAAQRKALVKDSSHMPHAKMTLQELFSRVKSGDTKELALVLKVDVAGSLEAVKGMVDKLSTPEVKVRIIHSAIGGITESDVLLSATANGVIVGFNVRPDGGAARVAKEKGIEIKTYSVIYELVDDLKKAMGGMLAPTVTEKSVGRAEVRNIFTVPKMGVIAGCFVTEGKITRQNMLRLVRDGKIVYEGKVGSLKRFKDDVKEVATGFECGIGIENFNDIKAGDVIEAFVREEQTRAL